MFLLEPLFFFGFVFVCCFFYHLENILNMHLMSPRDTNQVVSALIQMLIDLVYRKAVLTIVIAVNVYE